jgi:hypothetical protein
MAAAEGLSKREARVRAQGLVVRAGVQGGVLWSVIACLRGRVAD